MIGILLIIYVLLKYCRMEIESKKNGSSRNENGREQGEDKKLNSTNPQIFIDKANLDFVFHRAEPYVLKYVLLR